MQGRVVLLVSLCAAAVSLASGAQAGTTNGIGGSMPAYYDAQLFTINFMELGAPAEQSILAHNPGFNIIYQSDPGLPGGQPFISVIDAVPGDGFNPLWLEVQIAFTEGHTPRQLFSDDEIAAAVASGEITLQPTGEVYRCSVLGHRPVAPSATVSGTARGGTAAAAVTPTPGAGGAVSWGTVKAIYR
jgi:hypothetical protein